LDKTLALSAVSRDKKNELNVKQLESTKEYKGAGSQLLAGLCLLVEKSNLFSLKLISYNNSFYDYIKMPVYRPKERSRLSGSLSYRRFICGKTNKMPNFLKAQEQKYGKTKFIEES
jgi:hypothetical protein